MLKKILIEYDWIRYVVKIEISIIVAYKMEVTKIWQKKKKKKRKVQKGGKIINDIVTNVILGLLLV